MNDRLKNLLSMIALATLLLAPGAASAWWNEDWAYRTRITLDASQLAAARGVSEARVPLLLRLHDGNFRFLDARSDGTDLRFIGADDKTPLDYHVESFDGVAGIAYVWVDARDVSGDAQQTIWLYYGNENAAGVANAPATYDGDMALVYHFNEAAGLPRDQTANGNNAQSSTATPTFESLISQGLSFNGNMQARVPPSPSLQLGAASNFTWTAWIKPESERPQPLASVFTKLSSAGEAAEERLIVGLAQNRPFVRVVGPSGEHQEVAASSQVQSNAWTHLAVVFSAGRLSLYVNGSEAAAQAIALPELGGDSVIGAVTLDAPQGQPQGLIGKLDEMTLALAARSPAWIAIAAASQGREAGVASVSAKPEARGSFMGSGYFGVLLSAVTFDGWIVIGLLGVMLVVSMAVIYTRIALVRRVGRSNRAFLAEFNDLLAQLAQRRRAGDGGGSGGFPAPADPAAVYASPLYRLYEAGSSEVTQRLVNDVRKLDARAIESIKATLESTMAREQQSLGRQMVYLTIAISGGPFLGLLGTVVGVMITFAAIAAAGDVNVNAIAPGIAAALMATVAGLAVAIPALFAYNFLTSRIRELTTEMQVFANELSTKVSEIYANS